MRIRKLPSPAHAIGWLGDQARRQADRWTLWTPVALGLGAALYFAFLKEPVLGVALGAFAAMTCLLVAAMARIGPRLVTVALVLSACAVGGFGLAKLRAELVKTPVAIARDGPDRIEGWVVDVASPGQGGQRLLIAPARIGDWPAAMTPMRVRVTLRGGDIPAPGDAISLLAIINPPPPPASPGAYDFARDAYFESVGGVGFALGEPRFWTPDLEPPWRLRLTMRINAIRWDLTRRIVEVLGPERGGLAAAMTTGHEAFIPREQVENLRVSGLAHIVSISGLHMAIVGGFAFGAARLAIAAWPWLALRISGKKAAAVFGLLAVSGYLVLSGAPPPAERAAVTASVAFLAILADRQAISLHALALAAMAVLLMQPEAVTEPGFQMSFAATAALVALAERLPRPIREINTPWPIRAVQGAAVWIGGAIAVSFVAGMATGPFAIQHFNRVSTWGLLANLATAPISSFLLMPGLAVGAALTPFGLGEWPLAAAGYAIGAINWVAATAASAPHAQMIVASAPAWALPTAFLGLLFVCLWHGPLRWAGLPFALAVSLAPRPEPPAAWINADGAAVAVRAGAEAILMRPDVKLFGAELWARRRGLTPAVGADARDAAYDCDAWSCAPAPGAPVRIAAAWNRKRSLKPGRMEALCEAEVVIIRNATRPAGCGAKLVLTGVDFAAGGAAELYREADGSWRVVWAQDLRGRRPWTWGYDPR